MDLAERLLGPQFEAALEEHRFVKDPLLRAYAKAIRELHARLAAAKADLEDISDALPDDATHKHEVTGESLVDNVRDALRDLAAAKADLAAAREEIARLKENSAREDVAQLEKWLNEDSEMRLAEVLVGETYRWCVRLEQLVLDEPGSVKFCAEAGTFSEALRAAIDAARAGGGR